MHISGEGGGSPSSITRLPTSYNRVYELSVMDTVLRCVFIRSNSVSKFVKRFTCQHRVTDLSVVVAKCESITITGRAEKTFYF